jgi:ParB/RepB/Spo0J family partition protein
MNDRPRYNWVPNIIMGLTVASEDRTRRAEETRGIPTNLIDVEGRRMRPLDPERVKELAESIKANGLLQPIGIVRKKDGKVPQRNRLVYGRHRLAALQLLMEEGVPGADTAPCIVYPSEMSEDGILLAELIENLHRNELTPAERAAHTAKYAALLKKSNAVQNAKSKGNKAREPGPSVQLLNTGRPAKPTVTEKLVNDLGISRGTVHHRMNVAVKLAERQGVKIGDKKSIEKLDHETLGKVADAALEAAENKKEKARALGKGENRVDPYHYTADRTNRHYYLKMDNLPKSLDGILAKMWERSDSPITAEILERSIEILHKWAEKWRNRKAVGR